MKKRVFDIVLSIALLPILIPTMLLIALCIKLTSPGRLIYWSRRVGQNGVHFYMPKFRSLTSDAPVVSDKPDAQLHAFGKFIRSSGLDELPQLFSIVKGDMSFVGPRPLIPEEADCIVLRAEKKIDCILPGLTGWAQINGRNQLTPVEKVGFDMEYMRKQSLWFDIKILFLTARKMMKRSLSAEY